MKTKSRLTPRFWVALVLFSLIGQVAWTVENMYFNVFIYKMFDASAGMISAMVAASAVSATVTTVLIGALSDKIGKRKLFMCGGYILWGISIFAFVFLRKDLLSSLFPTVSAAVLGAVLVIILDCVMTFFGSSANDAAFNAWLTDSSDNSNRGIVEGVNSMMPLVSILVVFGGFMALDLEQADSWSIIFTVIGIVVTVIGFLGIFLIKDAKITPSDDGYLSNVIYGFRPSTVKANTSLYIYLLAFTVFSISIQVFMPYLIIYYEVSLQMADYVLIMAPAIVLASVATVLAGKLNDKKGFGFTLSLSLLSLCAGYLGMFLFRDYVSVFVSSLLMMCGFLSSTAVFGAKIRNLTPIGKSGRLQGVRIFSQVLLPGVIGPYIGKTVLKNAEIINNNDGTQSFIPNANIFLAALIVIFILIVFLTLIKFFSKPTLVSLTTPFEEKSETSWDEYPRPQMKRDSYAPLNGQWDLSVKKGDCVSSLGEITVPYPPESRISGIERKLGKNEKYVYTRKFSVSKEFNIGRILLHFGAVDQIADVTLNGKHLGRNVGGYLPFEFDITDDVLFDGDNILTVEVEDALNLELPYGKQCKKRGGMWYTPISGIWQSVWLESVPQNCIKELKITSDLSSVTLDTVGGNNEKSVILHTDDGDKTYSFVGDSITIKIDNPKLWSPEAPNLYSFTLTDGCDKIESYFALRTVSVETRGDNSYICLNGQPYFFNGLLDQGYFSDGIYTPYSPDGYLYDILTMKKLGFNTLRKHIKIEPDIFYYYCDKYGMIVFQDMVNSGKYHYILDTVLPTVGKRKGISHSATNFRREHFENTAKETVKLLHNHPSVCYYTVFNEGWGQYDADRIYSELKSIDGTRIWDATSGWFTEQKSDVTSDHIYFKKIVLSSVSDKPTVLSEFGGYSYKIADHSFNLDKTYGYRFMKNKGQFEDALKKLYLEEIIPAIKNDALCATVLTQVSDVEDETNGLVTYDRRVLKVDEAVMAEICKEAEKAFQEKILGK